ncbi:hypothetical protein G9P44_000906 [Scheffersomyces stipitis]|nr:hypothetical protein G9P44_000906 [Scheffersomyces stipitis]
MVNNLWMTNGTTGVDSVGGGNGCCSDHHTVDRQRTDLQGRNEADKVYQNRVKIKSEISNIKSFRSN